jgi:predicted glycoside hydrolase/deacetylase ChbG (UPF0249 family)
MRAIINADDLGANETVNDATFEMMSRKSVTSATLLANGPRIREAIRELVHFPNCSFGIHLNITEFSPLSSKEGLVEILDESGSFNGKFNDNILEVKKSYLLFNAITKEFCLQIEKLLSFEVKISHIDSHHHIHTIPHLFPTLKYLQKKYKIKKVRISKNIFKPNESIFKSKLIKKHIYNFMLSKLYKTKTTSGFTDLFTFCENAKLDKIQHDTVEVMVHPGQMVDEGENELLSSPWKENLPFVIDLINYNQL